MQPVWEQREGWMGKSGVGLSLQFLQARFRHLLDKCWEVTGKDMVTAWSHRVTQGAWELTPALLSPSVLECWVFGSRDS